MSSLSKPYLTPEQYLANERAAEYKSEYLAGETFAMAGAKLAHIQLSAQLIYLVSGQTAGRDCQPLGSDMRVFIPATGLYTYPDLSVVCGKLDFSDDDNLCNPKLIAEVLSPSTEAYDRGRKFEHYRTIESLEEYLLVAQDRVHVDLYTRQPDGRWLLTSASSLESQVELKSIGCILSLADLYARVQFGTLPPEAHPQSH